MEYREWLNQLFENTYPKKTFGGEGELVWDNEEYINCIWENKSYKLFTQDFYDEDYKEDFIDNITLELLKKLPVTQQELNKTPYFYKNYFSSEMHCVIERDNGIVIDQILSNDNEFNSDSKIEILKKELNVQNLDSILLVTMKKEHITPLTLLNHKKDFKYFFDDYIDYSPELKIIYDEEENKLFLGHQNPISRLEDTSTHKAKSLDEWYKIQKEKKDV